MTIMQQVQLATSEFGIFDVGQRELKWNKALGRPIVVIATVTGRIFIILRISEGTAQDLRLLCSPL
jgi:hypothetical protein